MHKRSEDGMWLRTGRQFETVTKPTYTLLTFISRPLRRTRIGRRAAGIYTDVYGQLHLASCRIHKGPLPKSTTVIPTKKRFEKSKKHVNLLFETKL